MRPPTFEWPGPARINNCLGSLWLIPQCHKHRRLICDFGTSQNHLCRVINLFQLFKLLCYSSVGPLICTNFGQPQINMTTKLTLTIILRSPHCCILFVMCFNFIVSRKLYDGQVLILIDLNFGHEDLDFRLLTMWSLLFTLRPCTY